MRASTDQPHERGREMKADRSDATSFIRAASDNFDKIKSSSNSMHPLPPLLVQHLAQRSDGRCFFTRAEEIFVHVTNYPGRPDLDRVRYTGEWTVICSKIHTHTDECPIVATGYGQVSFKSAKEAEADVVHRGWFNRGRPASLEVLVFNSEIDLGMGNEMTTLVAQPTELGSQEHLSQRDEAEPMDHLAVMGDPSSAPAADRTDSPSPTIDEGNADREMELSSLWYPNKGAANASEIRLVRIFHSSQPDLDRLYVRAMDVATVVKLSDFTCFRPFGDPCEKVKLTVPCGGGGLQRCLLLTLSGLHKFLSLPRMQEERSAASRQWIQTTLLPRMSGHAGECEIMDTAASSSSAAAVSASAAPSTTSAQMADEDVEDCEMEVNSLWFQSKGVREATEIRVVRSFVPSRLDLQCNYVRASDVATVAGFGHSRRCFELFQSPSEKLRLNVPCGADGQRECLLLTLKGLHKFLELPRMQEERSAAFRQWIQTTLLPRMSGHAGECEIMDTAASSSSAAAVSASAAPSTTSAQMADEDAEDCEMEVDSLWFPSKEAPDASEIRVVRPCTPLQADLECSYVRAGDIAAVAGFGKSRRCFDLFQSPSETKKLAIPCSNGQQCMLLTRKGLQKFLALPRMQEERSAAFSQWIRSTLLPALGEKPAQSETAEMEDSGGATGGGSSASAAAPARHSFAGVLSIDPMKSLDALNQFSAASSESAAAASSAAASSAQPRPQGIAESAAFSSSLDSAYGMIRVDGIHMPTDLDHANTLALEQVALARSGTRSETSWSHNPYTYRGFLKSTDEGPVRHGLGQSTYDSGSVFIGEYRDGKCNGQGRWTTHNQQGHAHIYEGNWLNDHESGKGTVEWTDADLGTIVATGGTFVDGLQHGEGCTWTLKESGHVFFRGRMEQGKLAHGRLTSPDNDSVFFDGSILNDQFHGLGCYSFNDGSFYFGNFRYHERSGLGILLVPRATDDDLLPGMDDDWRSADVAPFKLHPMISKQDAVFSFWKRKEEASMDSEQVGSSLAANSASSTAAAAAPAAACSSSDSDVDLVWQALHRMIREAIPTVLRLQHERHCRRALLKHRPAPVSPSVLHITECMRRALEQFSSSSEFHFISVPNATHELKKKGGCSYLVTGELGCAEHPYLCLTCEENSASRQLQDDRDEGFMQRRLKCPWEVCQVCAETSSCHAGHSLKPLPPSRQFVCDCGRHHSADAAQRVAAIRSLATEEHKSSGSDGGDASKAAPASASARSASVSTFTPSAEAAPAAASTSSAMEDEADGSDAESNNDAHVCGGIMVQSNPAEWTKAIWPATVARAERELQKREEATALEAMR